MKILLTVPSKDRVETLKKFTFPWLSLIKHHWAIFVEPQDFAKYKAEFPWEHIVVMDSDNQGLGYAKDYIQKFAEENGYDLIFKIDDDIKCFTDFRHSLSPEETAVMIDGFLDKQAIPLFENKDLLGAIAFPYSFEMYEPVEWNKTKRVQTAYICRTKYVAQPIKGISVFEDFAVGLQIMVAGDVILKYGMIGINMGVKVGGGTGGHQSFNRAEKALLEVPLLRKIYPPLKFKKVQKEWQIEPDLRSVKL